MGVTMSFRGLREIGQGRWEYRRRVPAPAKAAMGKSEWKRVITAKSDKELLRQYALVEAAFDQEVAAAKAPPAASAAALTPRAAWNEMLKQAEEMSAGVIGVDDPSEAREVVAESVVSLGRSDPLLVQALMDPHRLPPALTLQDAVNVYVKEHLGGGEGAEHRGTMVRLKRVLRYAAEVGLPTSTPLADLNREQARQVRDYMLSRDRTGGEGRKNFITNIIWNMMDSPKNSAIHFSDDHEYIIAYARDASVWRPNPLPRKVEMNARYKNPDNDPRGPWLVGDLACRFVRWRKN